ncbi:MAG: carboxy terminal-processing peptidase [Gammaproteobacteria bacterium]|nr:carboxy terminal-processing peptidase [Gammaproteobacteria bacterium]
MYKNNYCKSLFSRTFILILLLLPIFSYAKTSEISERLKGEDFFHPVYPDKNHPKLGFIIAKRLEYQHYLGTKLDDELSKQTYSAYIKSLDPTRSIFNQKEINQFDKFSVYIDEALTRGQLEPAFIIYNQYLKNQTERLSYMYNRLVFDFDKIDLSLDETLETDREEAAWEKDDQAVRDLWRRLLKNNVLSEKINAKDSDEKIIETLSKRFKNQLNRLKQTKSEDAFRIFINALAESYDPHTQYFSPRVSENFNIQMKLSLEGIGAMLSEEDGFTKIKRLVPGGPAHKAGDLAAGDRIIGVGQDLDGEIVDVIGWRLDDVVQLIRGKKGTMVRLKIIPHTASDDSENAIIQIVRNTVNLEEQSARKEMINIDNGNKTYKVGIINLPTFYIDFKGAQEHQDNYRSSTRDVKKLLLELKEENINGLVLDLRNNGGGSLQEVNTLLGLFIKSGPTVQIKSADGETVALEDEDHEVIYNGPLVVLVNRLSASASEIFAGAIQDYQRGLVIGDQTFGKGTVQALQPLIEGQLKVTHAKFYRVSGDSTQNQGVIPDILFPSTVDKTEIGESALPDALVWDKIDAAKYVQYPSLQTVIEPLKELHNKRAANDPDFTYVANIKARRDKIKSDTLVSLNLKQRQAKSKESQQNILAIENKRRQQKGKKTYASFTDMKNKLKELDEANEAKSEAEVVSDESKAFLHETAKIVVDFIKLKKKSKIATSMPDKKVEDMIGLLGY